MDLTEIFSTEKVRDVILDTDVYNELDDYYAIAYLFGHTDEFNIKGITIAPFAPIYNKKVKDVSEGVDASYKDTFDELKLMHREDFTNVYYGSRSFLADEHTPIESDAARFIIECSKHNSSDNRLYIIAIGAITNVASALLLDPTLKDRIAVVWLGGNAYFETVYNEFNLIQDINSARVVMGAELPFMHVPCLGVVSSFKTGYYELAHFIQGKNALCDYLFDKTVSTAMEFTTLPTWSRVIWDVVAVAALINKDNRYMTFKQVKRRLPEYETGKYEEETELDMLQVERVRRDPLMYDLFLTLEKYK